MIPLLFLVTTTTPPNSTGNGNHTQEDVTSPSHHILPTVLVLSLLLVIIALLAWYFLRLKNQRKAVVTTVDKKIPNGILEEQDFGYSTESLYTIVPPEQQTVVLLPRSPSASKTYFPIPVDHLEEEYRLRSADDGKLFREEYNSLPGGSAHGTYEEANKDDNKEKNRYPNILPYDHSRVVLNQLDGNPCSDYVNASYIDGFTEKNKFIAAQGPKEDTTADFWRMIWEQKVATVVMLTNHRCSTHSSTRPCLNTTSTETRSWMCRLWKDICKNCTIPLQMVTGLAVLCSEVAVQVQSSQLQGHEVQGTLS